MRRTFDSLLELPQVAQELLENFSGEHFYAFFGKMGVGKTTLIKEICWQLGVKDNVCSPTFAIINSYTTATGESVSHFDFYRLKSVSEAYDIGYEEYFYGDGWVFTEWTEKVEELLPGHYVRVELEENNRIRTLTANIIDD